MKVVYLLTALLLLATPVFAQTIPGLSEIERLGFPDILLWLLTFAILYGILAQVKVPASNAARAIISIVVAFLVLLAAPSSLISVISQVSSNLILVAIAILVFVAFLEIAQVRVGKTVFVKDEKTGKMQPVEQPVKFLEKYGFITGIFLLIVVVLIFIGSGGLGLVGVQNLPQLNLTGLFFFIVIILAVLWMLAESGKE
jgi:hypothetical protein